MPTLLTPADLKARFTGQKKTIAWYDAVLLYHKLKVHANGEMPIHLIKNARPNESDAVQEYREKIYEPETQNPIERVIGLLEKIRRSPDWMMRFNNDVPALIAKEETLQSYITENYPIYQSLENWLFEEALKVIAVDANAICIIMPKGMRVDPMAYMQPVAEIFNAQKIIDYKADDYVIVMSDEYSSLLDAERQQTRAQQISSAASNITDLAGVMNIGGQVTLPYPAIAQVYYVVTTTTYQKWEETNDGKHQLSMQFVHNLNSLPAFQLPGKFYKRIGDSIVKKTPLHPMVPHLNKAARESNDLDAGVIKHLHLKEWEINNNPCLSCNGVGKVASSTGPVPCKKCEGSGQEPKGPFAKLRIKPAAIGEQNVPIPPMGYVDLNPEILNIANTRIEQHLYKAFSSVNMEHLSDTPLNISGKGKELDRDEMNTLVYSFAESLCYVANTSVYWMNELRYKNLVSDEKVRRGMLPVIPVPEKYDVINTTFLISEYQSAKAAGLNSTILSELQKEIAQKKFYANPVVSSRVQTIMELDPFPDKTIEEKALLQGQGLATKEDVILSNYISDFVNQAIEEDKSFLEKTKLQKREVLMQYATAKMALLNTAKQMSADIFDPTKEDKKQGALA